ncbi:MAG TPA: OB-fold nucleic acid binding domain-containing protein [Acidimicrobiia bacterium]|jgi:RecG-like helicase
MALRKFVSKISKSNEDFDREKLAAFCGGIGVTPIADVHEREQVRTGGEIGALRIVPRSGAPALEVIVSDGKLNLTAVFLGRRKIRGMTPGRKVAVEGTVLRDGNRLLMLNPAYELY